MNQTRQRIISEARTWIGAPFRHQGRGRQGVDCAGLVVLVGQACGVLGDVPAAARAYPPLPNPRHIEQLLESCGHRVQAPRPGDVVWFGHRYATTHMGIWTGRTVIHADGIIGRVVAHKLGEPVRAAFRYPGVADG